jgi:hypothetical protein
MPKTIREQIVQEVMARLSPLISTPVLRREQYADENEFICVWDGEQETARTRYGSLQHTMEITIEFVKLQVVGPPAEAAGAMYAQAVTNVFMKDGQFEPTLNGLAHSMNEASFLPLTPEPGLKVTGCGLKLALIFETQNGDPFSQ